MTLSAVTPTWGGVMRRPDDHASGCDDAVDGDAYSGRRDDAVGCDTAVGGDT
jgi:hypothetical protein